MSQRRKPTLGGIVVIKCQQGHTLGRVASDPNGDNQPLDGPGWRTSVHDARKSPLSMRCPSCEAAGRRPDLRGAWSKVDEMCEQLESDYRIATLNYKLGG